MKKGYVFSPRQARQIGDRIGVDWKKVNKDEFRKGLAVELEHGKRDPQTNVTNDDEVNTGKIALAHLKEKGDYYTLLNKYVEKEKWARSLEDVKELEKKRKASQREARKEMKDWAERQRLTQMDILNIPKEERGAYKAYMSGEETLNETIERLASEETDPAKKAGLDAMLKEEKEQEDIDPIIYASQEEKDRIARINENIERRKRGEPLREGDRWDLHYYTLV
jgi:hypothetical protein